MSSNFYNIRYEFFKKSKLEWHALKGVFLKA
jgi:hypothetical protein